MLQRATTIMPLRRLDIVNACRFTFTISFPTISITTKMSLPARLSHLPAPRHPATYVLLILAY